KTETVLRTERCRCSVAGEPSAQSAEHRSEQHAPERCFDIESVLNRVDIADTTDLVLHFNLKAIRSRSKPHPFSRAQGEDPCRRVPGLKVFRRRRLTANIVK